MKLAKIVVVFALVFIVGGFITVAGGAKWGTPDMADGLYLSACVAGGIACCVMGGRFAC